MGFQTFYILGKHYKGATRNTTVITMDNKDKVTTLGLLWNPTTDQLIVKNNNTGANNRLQRNHKLKGASHKSIHILSFLVVRGRE
jgi:hypothetical protein